MSSAPGSTPEPSAPTVPAREARVLQFWKAVELFSPQRIPRVNPNSRSEPVFRTGGETPLPWATTESANWLRPAEQGRKWRFTAYCGIYNSARVRARLERRFGRDSASFDRRLAGESCLFAVQISSDGRPLLDTFVLASCPWALGRLETTSPSGDQWLHGFEAAAQEEALRLAERFAVRDNDEIGKALNLKEGVHIGRPIQPGDLETDIERVAVSLRIAAFLQPAGIRLSARQVSESFDLLADSDDFLNSFFLRDLDRVAQEASAGQLGPALSRFLSGDNQIAAEERPDIRASPARLWQNTSPALVPPGRWPSSPEDSLYFSQQLAINSALSSIEEDHHPLFAINGPPGTGKTTLLRDLVAAVVVKRATVLATLADPTAAFIGRPSCWSSGGYQRSVSFWRDDLLGFEMVVASSNNRAVENVTLEIPTATAIDSRYLPEADYFADFASRLLQEKKETGTPAWALVAARLGSKKNRRQFISRFWGADREPPEPRTRAQQGFLHYLKNARPKPGVWKNAVTAFELALADEAKIRAERLAAWKTIDTRNAIAASLVASQSRFDHASVALEQSGERIETATGLQTNAKTAIEDALDARRVHQSFKPGLVDALFSRGSAYRHWHHKDLRLSDAVDQSEKELQQIAAQLSALTAAHRVLAEDVGQLTSALARQQDELAALDLELHKWREKLGSPLPNPDRWLTDFDERELSSPWADEAWNRARVHVFIEALHLHRAFIESVPRQITNNLHVAIDILTGKASSVDSRALHSAWATLFFITPVVSTTFASFDRLFSCLGRESLGWLLIDEAGQAVPQSVAGALWRSKRAIVVGDPRQLEPIVALPFTAQQALRRHFAIEETWLPYNNSVQTLADRASAFGTWLESEDDDRRIWVGSPLRVHRRCEEPMFSISNRIAYGGQMVSATLARSSTIQPSAWIHINASESDDHWLPAEGVILEILLAEIFRSGVSPSDVLLISPFRVVARRLKEIAARHGIAQSGTIHVSQGKEADIVILLLGGNPRSPGAKEWASEKPNLLNVAVSRARRRLFVIGNLEQWSLYVYFSEAAAALQKHETLYTRRKSTNASSD